MRRSFPVATVLMAAVALLAFALRIAPITADLPSFTSLDEASYIETALRFGTGDFMMSSFFHGAFFQIVLFLEYGAYFVFGRLFGRFASPSDLFLEYLRDPTVFLLLARMTVVLCGVGTVWLTGAVARRAYGDRVALVASLFAAGSLLMFQMSSLALADVPAVFLLMLATYLIVVSIERPEERRLYHLAGVLIGLAAACKYHTGFGIIALFAAAFVKTAATRRHPVSALRLAATGALATGAGFAIGIPQALVAPGAFYEDVFERLGGQYVGYDPEGNAWAFIFTHHLRNGLGIPLEVVALVGLAFAFYRHTRWDFVMLAVPLSFYVLFMHSVGFAYHLLPATPFLLILGARVLVELGERVFDRRAPVVVAALAAVIVLPTLIDSVKFLQIMRSPSTKTAGRDWIEEHLPPGASVVAEGYVFTSPTHGPPLVESRATIQRDADRVRELGGTGGPAALRLSHYDELYDVTRAYDVYKVPALSVEGLDSAGSAYLVTSSYLDEPAGRELAAMFVRADQAETRREVRSYLDARYERLGVVAPTVPFTAFYPHLMDEDYRLIRSSPLVLGEASKGPTITIWRKRSS